MNSRGKLFRECLISILVRFSQLWVRSYRTFGRDDVDGGEAVAKRLAPCLASAHSAPPGPRADPVSFSPPVHTLCGSMRRFLAAVLAAVWLFWRAARAHSRALSPRATAGRLSSERAQRTTGAARGPGELLPSRTHSVRVDASVFGCCPCCGLAVLARRTRSLARALGSVLRSGCSGTRSLARALAACRR